MQSHSLLHCVLCVFSSHILVYTQSSLVPCIFEFAVITILTISLENSCTDFGFSKKYVNK